MEDNQILNNYIKEKRYDKCVSFIQNKIINYVLKQIQEKDDTINYTTISDLISASDYYLSDSSIAYKLNLALLENDILEQLNSLILICEEYNIR